MAELTARQREALEAGRKTRAANLAARRAGKAIARVRSHHAAPRQGSAPAPRRVPRAAVEREAAILPAQTLTVSAPLLPDSSSLPADADDQAASDAARAPEFDGADALEFAFEFGAEGLPDASETSAGSDGEEGEPRGFAGLVKRFSGKLHGTQAPRPSRGALSAQEDSEVSAAADELAPLATAALMLALGWLVGDELAPSDEQAREMIAPLLRIWARHMPALRTISPDASDLIASAGAFALYMQAIWPAMQARRRERKLTNVRALAGSGGGAGGRILNHPANVAAASGGASGGSVAAPADPVARAPERAGYYTEQASGSAGGDGAAVRYAGPAAADPSRVFEEITGLKL